VWRQPQTAIFKPVGVPLDKLERVTLYHEELEALRLADLERQGQTKAARQMEVSQSTFQRMLTEARYKVAQALVNGLALQVEGGNFRLVSARWHCADCGLDWELAHGRGLGPPELCPECGSRAIRERSEQKRRHLE
jgi:predicted DNA-binding protein (UPF0251 family)